MGDSVKLSSSRIFSLNNEIKSLYTIHLPTCLHHYRFYEVLISYFDKSDKVIIFFGYLMSHYCGWVNHVFAIFSYVGIS